MSYEDLRDFEVEFTYTADNGLTVEVEKLGGGTVGESYTGAWRYIVKDGSHEVAGGQDCETGMPHTHEEVARFIADYFADYLGI